MLRENARAQFWPVPVVGVVLALVLGVEMPRLDSRVDGSLGPSLSAYLFGGDADGARSVLGTIASSLITVTSLTVVTLQLASSQFSPRLLRNFVSDGFVHATLALFLGTFTYSLAVLRTVHGTGGTTTLFVPKISVTFAFVMSVVSVLGLVLSLAHLARQIRVETLLRNVHADASDTGQRVLPERLSAPTNAFDGPITSTWFSPVSRGSCCGSMNTCCCPLPWRQAPSSGSTPTPAAPWSKAPPSDRYGASTGRSPRQPFPLSRTVPPTRCTRASSAPRRKTSATGCANWSM